MKSAIFLILGFIVFPSMLKWQGSAKPYIDLFASLASLGCILAGIYYLII